MLLLFLRPERESASIGRDEVNSPEKRVEHAHSVHEFEVDNLFGEDVVGFILPGEKTEGKSADSDHGSEKERLGWHHGFFFKFFFLLHFI